MKASISPGDRPSRGDVVITTELGVHFLSVVPHPHRLSFRDLSKATEMAHLWAKANRARVWHQVDGTLRENSKRTA